MNEELHKELIQDMLIESYEGLDRFDQNLLALEKGASGKDTLNQIFRVIHTIKGTAGCLGFNLIQKAAHTGENLLSLLRDGKLTVHADIISALLKLSDALRGLLQSLEKDGNEGTADLSVLLEELTRLQTAPVVAAAPVTPAAPPAWGLFEDEAPTAPAVAAPVSPEVAKPMPVASASPSKPAAAFVAVSPPPPVVAAPAVVAASAPAPELPATPAPIASVPPPAAPAPGPTAAPVAETGPVKSAAAESAIRVNVDHLDRLMNLVGELVLARNQILQRTMGAKDSALQAVSQRLNLITTELQEGVMKTRMQPIGNVWDKFPRIVRDVAHDLGKRVRLELEGRETELDRTIIESIKDPLTHIIRNAIDHGIESPEKRRLAGKTEEGMLYLRAFHEGGQVNIEILDDGAGVNIERVKAKALQQGLITAEQAARLSDREAVNLVFLPGLSTAEKISNVSGRGVGMDVVKTNIEKIGGSVELQSAAGRGTTLKIKIPLTLAIIPALIVTTCGERFAIPQVSLLELVRVGDRSGDGAIESVFDSPVFRLRGKLLPLVSLSRVLKLDSEGARPSSCNIVVLQADGRPFGLIVDVVNDTEEIVVKPLGKQLKGISCFAGATIMGDGRVALILDTMGLAQHAQVVSEARDHALTGALARAEERSGDRQTLLLFRAGDRPRLAIPLSLAARLEEFERSAVERAGTRDVVQYRGQILPLIRVVDYLAGAGSADESDLMQVVVYSESGRSVGLVVTHIDDIVEEAVTVQRNGGGGGILGSVVVQGKVTDLLDVRGIVQSADPAFFETHA